MTWYYVSFAIINCFIGAVAALLLKKTSHIDWKKMITNKMLLSGLLIYGITAIFSVLILRKLDVTVFYPLTSVTYVFSLILAKKYLNEKVTKFKVIGITLILVGVALLVQS